MANKIVCIVGMPGSGKSVVSDDLMGKGFSYLRFGQITLDRMKESGLEVSEENERMVREEIRKEHGMGAFATLNIPKIDEMIGKSSVVVDGLYSWSEYKILKGKYGNSMLVVAVFAPPETRYERLVNRAVKNDSAERFRSISRGDAISRDYAEIEHLEKGGPIAMADFTLVNTGTIEDLKKAVGEVLKKI